MPKAREYQLDLTATLLTHIHVTCVLALGYSNRVYQTCPDSNPPPRLEHEPSGVSSIPTGFIAVCTSLLTPRT